MASLRRVFDLDSVHRQYRDGGVSHPSRDSVAADDVCSPAWMQATETNQARARGWPRSCLRLFGSRKGFGRSAFRRAHSRTPRCRCACRLIALALVRGSCRPAVPRIGSLASSPPTVTVGHLRERPVSLRHSPVNALASPKSRTLTMPVRVILRFGGLRITVDDPSLMRCVERIRDLSRNGQSIGQKEWARARCGQPASRLRPAPAPAPEPRRRLRSRRSRRCVDDSATRACALRAQSAPAAQDRW